MEGNMCTRQLLRLGYYIWLFSTGFLYTNASAEESPTFQFAGRTITLGLISVDNRAPVPWPAGESKLTTKTVITDSDTNISALLAADGIDPDSGTFSIVYDLNPSINKLDAVQLGAKIALPKIIASKELQQSLSNGSHLVVLYVDLQLQKELASNLKILTSLSSRLSSLPKNMFSPSENIELLLKQVDDITMWVDQMKLIRQQRKGPPTSRDTLIELVEEVEALTDLLKVSIDGKQMLSSEDYKQINAIHADMEREVKRYDDVMSGGLPDPDLTPCCRVKVNIKGGNIIKTENLRIYYALNGLFRMPPTPGAAKPFPKLGSSSSDKLRPKYYRFWVAPDGKPEQLLSKDGLYVEINNTELEKEIDIALKN
jgi:hypothetical protein